jgi:TRAP-type mannitol/chloroaromatic compound transport system substrate-binding protein
VPSEKPPRLTKAHVLDRRGLVKSAGAGAALALAACDEGEPSAPAGPKERIEWRMTTCWPKNLPGLGTGAQLLADTITEAAAGRLAVKLYAAGEIVPAFEAMDAVATGIVEMGHGGPHFWKGKVPAAQFLSNTPFGLTAQEQNAWYQYGGGEALADEIYAELGCKFFLAGNTGVQMGGWFNKEINALGDLKGLKMRMPGLGGEVLKAVGATIVNTDPGEIAIALQSGALDAADWAGPYADLAFGLHKSAKFYYYPGWHEPSAVLDLFVNRAKFEALPGDLQAVIEVAASAVNQLIQSEIAARNHAALGELTTRHDVQLRQFPMEVLMGLARTAERVLERIAGADPLSAKVYDSLTRFRRDALGWSRISEESYLAARLLPFKSGPKSGAG